MDELARYNKERWEELAEAGVIYSRPKLDLDAASARAMVDPEGKLGETAGRDVLCLAGGGGQQSAAFGLLGARVTVFDLCETQLQRDREAAAHYGHEVRTVQGDMRDLSCFAAESFDVVWHAHSLTFVPDAGRVFDEHAQHAVFRRVHHTQGHDVDLVVRQSLADSGENPGLVDQEHGKLRVTPDRVALHVLAP